MAVTPELEREMRSAVMNYIDAYYDFIENPAIGPGAVQRSQIALARAVSGGDVLDERVELMAAQFLLTMGSAVDLLANALVNDPGGKPPRGSEVFGMVRTVRDRQGI